MNKLYLLKINIIIILLAAFSSCKEKEDNTQEPLARVTFTCTVNDDDRSNSSSRSITANGITLTDLAIFDYVGGTLKNVTKQVYTDSNFGNPSLNLEYGEHRIVFVLSRGADFSIEGGICKWSKASDTFCKELTLNVTNNTQGQTVNLQRTVARLELNIQDAIPTTVKTIRMTPSRFYNDFSTISMNGVNSTTQSRETDISSLHGMTDRQIQWYTISPSADEWNINVTFTFLDAYGQVIATHTKNTVPLLSNRTTVIKGRCFDTSANSAMTLSVNDTWDSDYTLNLY